MPVSWASTSFLTVLFQRLLLLANVPEGIVRALMHSLQRGSILVVVVDLVELRGRCSERAPHWVDYRVNAAGAALLTVQM